MKIQCSCGTKVAFDVTPDMVRTRVQFVCPGCGLDSSDLVNELIRREFESSATVPETAPPISPQPSVPPPPPPGSGGGLRLSGGHATASPSGTAVASVRMCAKHPGQETIQECAICRKPMCPQCVDLFGLVCSPFCRERAELKGVQLPRHVSQRDAAGAREWRVAMLVTGIGGGLLALFLSVWIWYAWFGSVPGPVYSIRFEEKAQSGRTWQSTNELIFLHGPTLARCDLKTKQQLWSCPALDRKAIDDQVTKIMRSYNTPSVAAVAEMAAESGVAGWRRPSPEKMKAYLTAAVAAGLQLRVVGHNIWVASPEKLTRYDWDTGTVAAEFLIPEEGHVTVNADELIFVNDDDQGQTIIQHFDFATGESRVEKIPGAPLPTARRWAGHPPPLISTNILRPNGLDPNVIAAQYANMSLPARMALPATLSVARRQEETLDLLDEDREGAGSRKIVRLENQFILIPNRYGPVRLSLRLLEEKYVTRNAMKDPPKKSVLDGEVNVTQSAELANEILNDMQRQRTGGMITEDESRYLVTVRRPGVDGVADWQGEVNGPPKLYPLSTVDVIAAGKGITVIDKNNKLRWKSTLNYRVGPDFGWWRGQEEDPAAGSGPCVEHGDTLFVCDEGVLTAFDLASGGARWRLPSVGVSDLFFDDAGMLYVSSTTASPDAIKYALQIDVTRGASAVLMKLDPNTGKVLWSMEPAGAVAYVSGKFVYTLASYQPPEDDSPYTQDTGFETPPYMRIQRINPRNGHMMWEHFEKRAPVNVEFDKNTIRCVFRKEVEVLKFLSL